MSDRVAVVTGAASGIGRAIALRLAQDGFAVAIADVNEAGAKAVADEIAAAGGRGAPFACDVAALTSVVSTCEEIDAALGGIDLLVNNAGLDIPGFFLETDPKDWNTIVGVVLMGTINFTYAAAPAIIERCHKTGYGRIVNIASDAGRVGALGEAVYSAAKGGVIAFTKTTAREFARDKVTVNAVCPGPADTPMSDAIKKTDIGQKLFARMIDATPLKRLALPEDVAGAVAYFASDEASFLTAQVLSVSGGLTIGG